MFPFKNLKIIFVLLVLVLVSCSLGKTPELKSNGYVITAEEDGPSHDKSGISLPAFTEEIERS